MLFLGGREVVIVTASCSIEINVCEVGVLLMVFHDSPDNFFKCLSFEENTVQIQVLEVCHGSDGVAEKLHVVFSAFREPGDVSTASEVGDCGQAVAASQRRQHHSTLSLIIDFTELFKVHVGDLRAG